MASPPVPRPTRSIVAGALKTESRARPRHGYRTPVNHIVGYSELLIEEAGERHLEVFIPVFQRICEGARELLESIESAFSEDAGPDGGWAENSWAENSWEGEAFRGKLNATSRELSQTLSSLAETLEGGHRETIADLDAIAGAIQRVREFIRQEDDMPSEMPDRGPSNSVARIGDLFRELAPIPAKIRWRENSDRRR